MPYHLETSVPGVFVAGDARAESAKRVASAVGEGAMSVMLVHRYLEKLRPASEPCSPHEPGRAGCTATM
jgi:thioredoxin reductase